MVAGTFAQLIGRYTKMFPSVVNLSYNRGYKTLFCPMTLEDQVIYLQVYGRLYVSVSSSRMNHSMAEMQMSKRCDEVTFGVQHNVPV